MIVLNVACQGWPSSREHGQIRPETESERPGRKCALILGLLHIGIYPKPSVVGSHLHRVIPEQPGSSEVATQAVRTLGVKAGCRFAARP